MLKPILNLDEVEFDDVEENGLYTSKRSRISDHIGAKKLGYNLTILPPGKVQCPFHCHHGEEEMFLILEGEGELRFGDGRVRQRGGNWGVTGAASFQAAAVEIRTVSVLLPGAISSAMGSVCM